MHAANYNHLQIACRMPCQATYNPARSGRITPHRFARSTGVYCTNPYPGGTRQLSLDTDPVLMVTTLMPHDVQGSLLQPALYVLRGHTVMLAPAAACAHPGGATQLALLVAPSARVRRSAGSVRNSQHERYTARYI